MQVIKCILNLSGGEATVRDENGRLRDAPETKIGVAAALELDLRSDAADPETGQLMPYPFEELSSADSFYFCLDGDWDHDTQPKLFKTSGISLTQSEDGRTIFRVELPETATPTLMAAVAKNKSIPLIAEFAGYSAASGAAQAIFAWSFSITLKNRIFIGDTPPAEVVNDPQYLNAAEVMALIADATRPIQNPGPKGDEGPPGPSAYQLAVANGYEGTITEWIAELEGESAYEAAVAEGYTGTRPEWLESLKGADGKGLEFDATGTFMQKALYDDRPAGFKFAATVVDSVAKKTTLYIYAKASNNYADWCENPVVIVFYSPAAANVASIAPVEFTAPDGGDNNYLYFDLAEYPNAHITQVVIDTADGELALPYWSDQGVRKILRKDGSMYIYFGANVPAYETGRVYLSQMVAAAESSTIPITSRIMYYGYVQDESMTSVFDVTADMLIQSTMTSTDAATLNKQSLGAVPAGAWIIALVPSGYVATKFDGVSGKTAFAENAGAPGTGANGTIVEIEGKSYKLYGEFQLTTAEKFIYIDVV